MLRSETFQTTLVRCVVVYAVKKTHLEVCTMGNAGRTCWISPYWVRISGNTHCINSCTYSNTRRKCVMCRFNSHNNTAVFTVYIRRFLCKQGPKKFTYSARTLTSNMTVRLIVMVRNSFYIRPLSLVARKSSPGHIELKGVNCNPNRQALSQY